MRPKDRGSKKAGGQMRDQLLWPCLPAGAAASICLLSFHQPHTVLSNPLWGKVGFSQIFALTQNSKRNMSWLWSHATQLSHIWNFYSSGVVAPSELLKVLLNSGVWMRRANARYFCAEWAPDDADQAACWWVVAKQGSGSTFSWQVHNPSWEVPARHLWGGKAGRVSGL